MPKPTQKQNKLLFDKMQEKSVKKTDEKDREEKIIYKAVRYYCLVCMEEVEEDHKHFHIKYGG